MTLAPDAGSLADCANAIREGRHQNECAWRAGFHPNVIKWVTASLRTGSDAALDHRIECYSNGCIARRSDETIPAESTANSLR